jgi:hypothetical protein
MSATRPKMTSKKSLPGSCSRKRQNSNAVSMAAPYLAELPNGTTPETVGADLALPKREFRSVHHGSLVGSVSIH